MAKLIIIQRASYYLLYNVKDTLAYLHDPDIVVHVWHGEYARGTIQYISLIKE
jgi:hypothetical protein